jgi:hypothetical protein
MLSQVTQSHTELHRITQSYTELQSVKLNSFPSTNQNFLIAAFHFLQIIEDGENNQTQPCLLDSVSQVIPNGSYVENYICGLG